MSPYYESPMGICPSCQLGHLHTKHRPYVELHYQRMFCIQAAPCALCDVCGYFEFDEMTEVLMKNMVDAANHYSRTDSGSAVMPYVMPSDDDTPEQPRHSRLR